MYVVCSFQQHRFNVRSYLTLLWILMCRSWNAEGFGLLLSIKLRELDGCRLVFFEGGIGGSDCLLLSIAGFSIAAALVALICLVTAFVLSAFGVFDAASTPWALARARLMNFSDSKMLPSRFGVVTAEAAPWSLPPWLWWLENLRVACISNDIFGGIFCLRINEREWYLERLDKLYLCRTLSAA